MHGSTYYKMEWFKNNYLNKKENETIRILDVGSGTADLDNGSYFPIFDNENWEYAGLDLEAGPNVTYVVEEPYNWKEVEDNAFDVIISGSVFEHIEYPWLSIKEVSKKLKDGGLCCILVPSKGPYHNAPKDCYRYFPDGLESLAKWGDLKTLQSSITNSTIYDFPWGDCILIAQKSANNSNEYSEIPKIKFSVSQRISNTFTSRTMKPLILNTGAMILPKFLKNMLKPIVYRKSD